MSDFDWQNDYNDYYNQATSDNVTKYFQDQSDNSWDYSAQNPSWVGQTDQVDTYKNGPSMWDNIKSTLTQPIPTGNNSNYTIGGGLFDLAKLFMTQQASKDRMSGRQSALNAVQGAADPYKRNYQDKLFSMMMSPGSYTQTPESNQALRQGLNAASRLAAAQGRSGQIPQLGANLASKFGLDQRERELNRLTTLAAPDHTTATSSANILSSIGDLKAQRTRDMLQQVGMMGTRSGALPDYTGSFNSNNSLLQALALIQSLGV